MAQLKYIDNRPIYFPKLTKYPNGLIPALGQVIEVTENEKIKLLKQKNGKQPCWQEVRNSPRPEPSRPPKPKADNSED